MTKNNKLLSIWLFSLCILIAIMVVFGGYVRLTRSGLSIVEWHVITGVIPPLSEMAWQETFAKYQQSPEFQKINHRMTLTEYKFIYYMEYLHRLLGRITGLVLIIPMLIFLQRGIIPRQQTPIYLGIGLLFALQGFMGWYMVASGLVDNPHVSHYRLTAHLFLALILLGVCFWLGLMHSLNRPLDLAPSPILLRLLMGFGAILLLQISYGGFVAGLKAGYLSNTFPLIGGSLIPAGLITSLADLSANPLTVHFIHRWLAFIVLGYAITLYYVAARRNYALPIQQGVVALIIAISTQILLGISVIIFNMQLYLALIHQGFALVLFLITLYTLFRLLQNR